MSAKEEWSRVIARAWTDPNFMARLNADLEGTLEDENVRTELNLEEIGERGNYLPLGTIPEGQEDKTEAELEEFIQENAERLFGISMAGFCCIP